MLPELRPEAQDLITRVKDFIEQDCIPSEHIKFNSLYIQKICIIHHTYNVTKY